LGELAAGTAHELNNALAAPMSMLSLLQMKPDMAVEKRQNMVEKAIQGMEQARTIVEGLLRFSRSERNEKTKGSINDDARFVINLFHKECAHVDIGLHHNLREDIPDVFASHQQIQQILLNLVANAKYVSHKGDSITVSTQKHCHKGVDGVMIKVADTGAGMDKETQQRIFEPFFSTKPVGEGTGLGLSICYGIVHDHGGTMMVQSHVGEGTTFSIWLPIGQQEAKQ